MAGLTVVPLALIQRSREAQSRTALDNEHVARLVDALARGETIPAPLVFHDGTAYHLADGFHRLAAYEQQGAVDVEVEARAGSHRDAVLYSVGANAAHGLPRSNADKRRAVEILLHDAEWSRWSDREIARRAVVHHQLVARLRSETHLDDHPDTTFPLAAAREILQSTASNARVAAANLGGAAVCVEVADGVTTEEIAATRSLVAESLQVPMDFGVRRKSA